MKINDLLVKERALYLTALRGSLEDQKKSEPHATSEVLIEINSNEITGIYKLIRPDIIYRGNEGEPKITEVNKQTYFSFDPYGISIENNVRVTISPLHWNGVEFKLTGDINNWGPFEDWAKYWLDIDDSRYVEGTEWLNVIHSVTTPRSENGCWHFSIDFGTAEVTCINPLFSALVAIGAKGIEMGSPSMLS